MCTIAVVHNGIPMMIPTAYGRKEDVMYFHGSTKNFLLNQALENETICVSISHLDGLVLAKTLFNTSVNYRSATVFGKAELITDKEEHIEGLRIITDNIIPDRWEEVVVGDENQLKATMVIKMKIDRASVKIRDCGPNGDEKDESDSWSGHIPLKTIALEPVYADNRSDVKPISESVKQYVQKHS